MELRYSKNNTIRTSYVSSGLTGVQIFSQEKQYSVDLGTILYNGTFVSLNSLVIPLKNQTFFNLPQDKNKHAVINVYYDIENGQFVFDKIGIFDKYVDRMTAPAIPNAIPVAQFILQQNQNSFDVVSYNEYSQTATFTITDAFTQGVTGLKSDMGETGPLGITGFAGIEGYTGLVGFSGLSGLTGISETGIKGIQGETGFYVDDGVLLYMKFKTSDDKQTDFSPYERDCAFQYTGCNDDKEHPLSYFIKEPGIVDSCHNVIHDGGMSYYKRDEFLRFGNETGTIRAWIKLTQKPIADFTYYPDKKKIWTDVRVTGMYGYTGYTYGYTGTYTEVTNSLRVHFSDISKYEPTSRKWWIKYDNTYEGKETGIVFTEKDIVYDFGLTGNYNVTGIYGLTGPYLVRLVVSNKNGSSEISKFISVS